jgi:la-related protein 1
LHCSAICLSPLLTTFHSKSAIMAAAASRPEMPSFSYAQAAKGLSTPPAQPPPKSSLDQPQTVTTPAEEPSSTPATVSQNTTSSSTEAELHGEVATVEPALDAEPKSSNLPATKNIVSGTSSPSVGTASTSTIPKEDDVSFTPNGSSESTWDKQSQASVAIEKPSAGGEIKKEASSDSPAAEKVAPPANELKAAPIPTVNVWQVRREAQEAKAKATAVAMKPVPAGIAKPASGKPSAPNSHPANENQDQSKISSKKKAVSDSQGEVGSSHGKERRRNDATKIRDEGKPVISNNDLKAGPMLKLVKFSRCPEDIKSFCSRCR